MLKVQHIPLSVGNTVKMAAQSSLRPFQKHFLSIECSPLLAPVMPSTSKHGSCKNIFESS